MLLFVSSTVQLGLLKVSINYVKPISCQNIVKIKLYLKFSLKKKVFLRKYNWQNGKQPEESIKDERAVVLLQVICRIAFKGCVSLFVGSFIFCWFCIFSLFIRNIFKKITVAHKALKKYSNLVDNNWNLICWYLNITLYFRTFSFLCFKIHLMKILLFNLLYMCAHICMCGPIKIILLLFVSKYYYINSFILFMLIILKNN